MKKNLSGGKKQPCKHGSSGAKDGLNSAIVHPDNAPPTAQPSPRIRTKLIRDNEGRSLKDISAFEKLSRKFNDPTPIVQCERTPTFQAFLDSLKTSPRKVTKLSVDYATKR